jgi:methyl-accepting chemotaxis protein
MRIATIAKIAGATLACGFLAIIASGWLTLRELKVGGPIYHRIVLGKELVADVVPPPIYLIDAFIEATLIASEPWSLEPRKKRLEALHKAYDVRQAFWKQQGLGKELHDQLLIAVHEPAKQFWEAIETRYLPAHAKGDKDGADNAFLAIAAAFEEHRNAVTAVASLANRFSGALEAEAAARERVLLLSIAGMAALVLAIVIACIGGVIVGLVRPVARIKSAMAELASGNLETAIPGEGRRDEIGEMANAVQVFRDAAIDKARIEREAEDDRRRSEGLRRHAEQEAINGERSAVAGSIGTALSKLAAKDLTYRMTGDIPEAYLQLQADFNTAAGQLEQAMQSVAASTGVIHSGSQEISSATDDLARRTEQQSASLEKAHVRPRQSSSPQGPAPRRIARSSAMRCLPWQTSRNPPSRSDRSSAWWTRLLSRPICSPSTPV